MSSVVSNESVLATGAELPRVENLATVKEGIPRWADAVIAVFALTMLVPVLAVLASAVAVSTGFPVFFRQRRVGRDGRIFEIVKLRTMKPSSDGPQVTRSGDQRITRLGRFLRQTKLDELPTLWNVVRGEMALVGPRPEVPRYVNLNDPLWQAILKVRPGLTDPVTISLRNEEELLAEVDGDSEHYYVNELQPSKLKGYVDYLHHRTARSDAKILWLTLVEVIRRR